MIYLDHGATTAVLPEVVEAMTPYFMEYYGNPSGHYEYGETSKKAIEQVRRTIADSLGAQPEEIYFTAGGTESDNWAPSRNGRPSSGRAYYYYSDRASCHTSYL